MRVRVAFVFIKRPCNLDSTFMTQDPNKSTFRRLSRGPLVIVNPAGVRQTRVKGKVWHTLLSLSLLFLSVLESLIFSSSLACFGGLLDSDSIASPPRTLATAAELSNYSEMRKDVQRLSENRIIQQEWASNSGCKTANIAVLLSATAITSISHCYQPLLSTVKLKRTPLFSGIEIEYEINFSNATLRDVE